MIAFIIVAILCAIAVVLYACCIAAHRADKRMERIINKEDETDKK